MFKVQSSKCMHILAMEGNNRKRGAFSIPSLQEIKEANRISAGSKPALFKPSSAHLQSSSTPSSVLRLAELPPKRTEQSGTGAPSYSHGKRKNTAAESSAVSLETSGDSITPCTEEGGHVRERAAKLGLGNKPSSSGKTTENTCIAVAVVHCGKEQLPGGGGSSTRPKVDTGESSSERKAPSTVAAGVAMTTESSSFSTTAVPHHHSHTIVTNPVQVVVRTARVLHVVLLVPMQKNNPVMKHIRNVPWELGDIVPDFVLGGTTCALFLSVRYHSLHPDYIHTRLKQLGKQFELRILLVLVDTTECQKALHELAKIAILADLTLIVAWSYEEAGRYLETYKAYENKPPDLLMERVDSDFSSRVTESLTTVKKVNKTDAATLINNFKTMDKVITASKEELTLCPGLGPQKAQRLYDLFHESLIHKKKPKLEQ